MKKITKLKIYSQKYRYIIRNDIFWYIDMIWSIHNIDISKYIISQHISSKLLHIDIFWYVMIYHYIWKYQKWHLDHRVFENKCSIIIWILKINENNLSYLTTLYRQKQFWETRYRDISTKFPSIALVPIFLPNSAFTWAFLTNPQISSNHNFLICYMSDIVEIYQCNIIIVYIYFSY